MRCSAPDRQSIGTHSAIARLPARQRDLQGPSGSAEIGQESTASAENSSDTMRISRCPRTTRSPLSTSMPDGMSPRGRRDGALTGQRIRGRPQ